MANEVTVNATLAYADSEGADLTLSTTDYTLTVSTKKFVWAKQNIGITEEAIGLGEVTSLGFSLFLNRDLSNFIELRTATSGTKFAKLKAAVSSSAPCPALFHFGSGISAPFAIADTAACQMEYLIISQ